MTDVPTYIVRGEDNDWVEPPETNWWVCRDGKNVALGLSKEDADSIAAGLNRLLDLEAAASEAVTEEMVRVAWDAHADGAACEVLANTGQVYAALLAVAPALLLAGEARGLERAAEMLGERAKRALVAARDGTPMEKLFADRLAEDAERQAAAIRALGRPA